MEAVLNDKVLSVVVMRCSEGLVLLWYLLNHCAGVDIQQQWHHICAVVLQKHRVVCKEPPPLFDVRAYFIGAAVRCTIPADNLTDERASQRVTSIAVGNA